MTNASPDHAEPLRARSRPAFGWALGDGLVLAKRQLRQIPRVPDELVTAIFQPIIIIVLFRYLFGGALATAIHGTTYVNYLMAGVFAEALLLATANTGVGIANDLQRGIVDRFRSLPMAPSAVLTGRIAADQIRNIIILAVCWGIGLLVGFRPEGSPLNWIVASGLLLLLSFVFSWLSALIGLLFRSVEAVQQAALIWLLPFLFLSSAFVPVGTLPDWLQVFATHQPVSLMMDAVRGLLLNQPDASTIVAAVLWCGGLLVVLIPLATWRLSRRARG
jgi:ABC-2 type transport system permease protein/oleandomycin transport system permease protein